MHSRFAGMLNKQIGCAVGVDYIHTLLLLLLLLLSLLLLLLLLYMGSIEPIQYFVRPND